MHKTRNKKDIREMPNKSNALESVQGTGQQRLFLACQVSYHLLLNRHANSSTEGNFHVTAFTNQQRRGGNSEANPLPYPKHWLKLQSTVLQGERLQGWRRSMLSVIKK